MLLSKKGGIYLINIKEIDALVFAENNCYVEIISVEEAKEKYGDFFVDLANETWTLNKRKVYKIGKSRSFRENEYRYGTIGVYNSAERKQRRLMIRSATEAVRSPCTCLD